MGNGATLSALTPQAAAVIVGWVGSRADATLMGGPLLPWPLTAEALLELDSEPTREVLVLTDAAGRVVASAAFLVKENGRVLRIGRVIVDPSRRGEGWGRALLEALLARADADPGVEATELGVFTHNAVARGLYERLGFTPTGETREVQVDGAQWEALDLNRVRPGLS
ncbi:MAG: GNAT family protein [Propionicimonas sp.]|nr:GNAT family protein [Propionicimonas sp.]